MSLLRSGALWGGLLALSLIAPSAATEWSLSANHVSDGTQTSLIGLNPDGFGVSFSCVRQAGVEAAIAVLASVPPGDAFDALPGDSVNLGIGDLSTTADLLQNDSAGISVMTGKVTHDKVLDLLRSHDQLAVTISTDRVIGSVTVETNGAIPYVENYRKSCDSSES